MSGSSSTADLAGTRGIVTGATGFIGRHVLALLPAGCTVIATHSAEAPDWPAGIAADVQPLRIDLLREPLDVEADWLLHLAARIPSAGDVDGIEEAARNAAAATAARVVHASSGSVYSGSPEPFGPSSPLAPVAAYGQGKSAAEAALGPTALHARIFNPFGPGERPTRLIASLVAAAAAGSAEVELRMPAWHRTQPIAVADVAAMLVALLGSSHTGALDVAGRESLDAEALVRRIYAAVAPGLEPAIRLEEAGTGDWLAGAADPAPAEAATGVEPTPLDDALRAYARG